MLRALSTHFWKQIKNKTSIWLQTLNLTVVVRARLVLRNLRNYFWAHFCFVDVTNPFSNYWSTNPCMDCVPFDSIAVNSVHRPESPMIWSTMPNRIRIWRNRLSIRCRDVPVLDLGCWTNRLMWPKHPVNWVVLEGSAFGRKFPKTSHFLDSPEIRIIRQRRWWVGGTLDAYFISFH